MPQPKPYNGNEPYLFVSYSRKDKEQVFPIIEYLQENGFRIWYDEGIPPGEETYKYIAKKILECEKFVSFRSDNYFNSKNCKRELLLADEYKIKKLRIRLRNEHVPPEFMLIEDDDGQFIRYDECLNMSAFLEKLLETPNIEKCRANENPPDPDRNNPSAKELFEQGCNYFDAKNYEKAIDCFRRASEHGLAKAQVFLGICYSMGIGLNQNKKEAINWFRKAAEQGDADAQFELGKSYALGEGITQDFAKAVKWYQRAAEQGHAESQYCLGIFCELGNGLRKNEDEAVKWYQKAAEQGFSDAQFELGQCYFNGQGVKQNREEAVKWYRRAAELGLAEAQCALGCCYAMGTGIKQDDTKALKWLQQSAEQGDVNAQLILGKCFESGKCVYPNNAEAIKWYRKAAEQAFKKQ